MKEGAKRMNGKGWRSMTLVVAVTTLLSASPITHEDAHAATFTHTGILYSQEDFDRAKTNVASGASPWIEAWEVAKLSKYASPTYTPSAVAAPARYGSGASSGNQQLFDDSTAALTQAIIWKVSDNAAEAATAKTRAQLILDTWANTVNTAVGGDENHLLAGLTAYKLAAAADIMRADGTWVSSGKLAKVQTMLKTYFYPPLKTFLANHQGKNNGTAYPYYYRGNQDQAALISMMAIGVLCDDLNIYNEAVTGYKSGA